MAERLKPCPFCSGVSIADIGLHYSLVRCRDCKVRTLNYLTVDEAITAWNRRHEPPEAVALVAYADHQQFCSSRVPGHELDCDCGYRQALAAYGAGR